MGNQNITTITLRMQHHAGASGYDVLAKYLNADVINTEHEFNYIQRILLRICRSKVRGSDSLWYHRANFMTEISAALKWISSKNRIFHFLYGENSYRYLGNIKSFNKSNRLLCTYHTPPTRFKELIKNTKFINVLDAVVVVSTVQLDCFTKILGHERVHYVPHGININYFKPLPTSRNTNNFTCISVGSHLRDFQTLAHVANDLKSVDIEFNIVTNIKNHNIFKGMKNVKTFSSINDDELLKLYQSSDILLLPLLDCTANNAILEGMACGLPIISTEIIGVKDYTNSNCSILAPKSDSIALSEAVLSLYEDKEKHKQFCLNSREQACKFNWFNVTKKIQEVYEQVANC